MLALTRSRLLAAATWITELGHETNPPDATRHFSPAQQATWLPEAARTANGAAEPPLAI